MIKAVPNPFVEQLKSCL